MSTDAPDPTAVIEAFGLPGPVTGWEPVGGAWSNRVYRLDAGGRRYAVKEMRNPWGDPRWQEWLAEAWSFEQQAIAAGVGAPRPVPNPADGTCLAWVRRSPSSQPSPGRQASPDAPVRVHHWTEGVPAGPGPVDRETARWAGRTLATVHGLRITPRNRDLFPVTGTAAADRWPELTEAARRNREPWTTTMEAAAPAVTLIADLVRSAGFRPDQEVMTHGDIDQKNLLVTTAGPVLCDWDLAAPLVPRRELADVAMSLAGWTDLEIAREVVRSYRERGGDGTAIEPPDLGQSMMIGLDWVAFNVERAIGLRAVSAQEASLARELVPGLLAAIGVQAAVAARISL
ncbi:MAG TPA: aminoglycoside phosphotransferase family protein [Streptosporangiaceae bacterium]